MCLELVQSGPPSTPSPSPISLPQPRISVPARPPSINQSVSRYLCGENPKYSSKLAHVKSNSTITILTQHIHAHKLTYSYKLTILIQTNSYTYQLQLGVNKSNQNTTTRTLLIFSTLSSVLFQKRKEKKDETWLAN